MKKGIKFGFIALGGILAAALIAGGWFLAKAIPVGAGYVAKYLCSTTFISKRNPDIVFREDISPVNPLSKIVDYKIDRKDG